MRKKNPEKSLEKLKREVVSIQNFITSASESKMTHLACCFDFAVIWLYRAFEEFVLDIVVAQINRNPEHLYSAVGVGFGKNPTAAQCEFLLVGDRYFDFKGFNGLLDVIRKSSGSSGALVVAVKKEANRKSFEILVALRNFATHESDHARNSALKAMKHWEPNRRNLGSVGNWLKVSKNGTLRMQRLLNGVSALCEDMKDAVT